MKYTKKEIELGKEKDYQQWILLLSGILEEEFLKSDYPEKGARCEINLPNNSNSITNERTSK